MHTVLPFIISTAEILLLQSIHILSALEVVNEIGNCLVTKCARCIAMCTFNCARDMNMYIFWVWCASMELFHSNSSLFVLEIGTVLLCGEFSPCDMCEEQLSRIKIQCKFICLHRISGKVNWNFRDTRYLVFDI